MLCVDNAAGFPDAGAHRLSIASRRLETDNARGRIIVLKIVSPDRPVAAFGSHDVAAEGSAIFTNHYSVLAHVDVVWIDRDVAARRNDLIRVINNCK